MMIPAECIPGTVVKHCNWHKPGTIVAPGYRVTGRIPGVAHHQVTVAWETDD